jgi:hypothetical protein
MMHVSWTTLREQIFAKLRRPYRSEANMNEVGHVTTEYKDFAECDYCLEGILCL